MSSKFKSGFTVVGVARSYGVFQQSSATFSTNSECCAPAKAADGMVSSRWRLIWVGTFDSECALTKVMASRENTSKTRFIAVKRSRKELARFST